MSSVYFYLDHFFPAATDRRTCTIQYTLKSEKPINRVLQNGGNMGELKLSQVHFCVPTKLDQSVAERIYVKISVR